jgi:hypothetical protein
MTNRLVQAFGCAICAAGLALTGCSAAGTPHLGAGPAIPSGVHPGVVAASLPNLRKMLVPNHVITFDAYEHAGMVDPKIAAPYLDIAEVQVADANAFAAAGIKTLLYTDPNRSYVGSPMYTNDETTFAHDCNGARITVGHRPVTTYQMDPRSPNLEPIWATWVNNILGAGYDYTYIFEDGANNIHNTSAKPCGYTEPTWTAASNANDLALGETIIYNGLGTLADGWSKPPPSILLNPTTFGGSLEGCYGNEANKNPLPKTVVWLNYETSELTMNLAQKHFDCRGLNSFPAQSSVSRRMYQMASFLLTYDLNTSDISDKFTTPSHLSVFPEEGLVALDPLIPTPSSVSKLKLSHWTYGRQYADCYLWGQAIGACATVVNAGVPTSSQPFPWPGVYNHTLVLSGAGVLDGGTASATGPPPPATVPGTSALIAIQ